MVKVKLSDGAVLDLEATKIIVSEFGYTIQNGTEITGCFREDFVDYIYRSDVPVVPAAPWHSQAHTEAHTEALDDKSKNLATLQVKALKCEIKRQDEEARNSVDVKEPKPKTTARRVKALLEEGRSVKDIATILSLSPATVSYHKKRMGL